MVDERPERPTTSTEFVPMADQERAERSGSGTRAPTRQGGPRAARSRLSATSAAAWSYHRGSCRSRASPISSGRLYWPRSAPAIRCWTWGQRIDVRESDVFHNVSEKFDLIVFDPPFRWFTPRDMFEAAMTDENYAAMTRFFREARQHLRTSGRMLIFFGTSGDLDYLEVLAKDAGFHNEVVARRTLHKDGWQVDYLTFRMTQLALAP